jgi:thiol-disulfide isomerase/thioredoxin
MTPGRLPLALAALALVLLAAGGVVVALAVTPSGGSTAAAGAEAPQVASAGPPNLRTLDPPAPAPQVAFEVEGGRSATLADYRGRAVLLNFWATWCPPCRQEMPSLERLAARLGGDDLVVMTMSVDRGDESQITDFYERIGAAHLGIFRDPEMSLAHRLHVVGLPTTVLIDADGMIVAEVVGAVEWDSPAAVAALRSLMRAAHEARAGGLQQARAD